MNHDYNFHQFAKVESSNCGDRKKLKIMDDWSLLTISENINQPEGALNLKKNVINLT